MPDFTIVLDPSTAQFYLLKKEGELVNGFAPEVAWVTMGGSEKLHEAFDGVGRLGAGELFLFGLLTGNDGDGEDILKEVRVAAELLCTRQAFWKKQRS